MESPTSRTRRLAAPLHAVADESVLVVVCSAFVGAMAVFLPIQLSSDSWLALVSGRLIADRGLPHHDTLAVLTAGRDWIDQQWLGQLAIYGLDAIGGLRLLLGINILLVSGAFVAAAAFARRRGAYAPTVGLVALGLLLPYLVTAAGVRTQSLVYVPFVAMVVLLARPRVGIKSSLFALAALVVWANVHGSVLLAAALVMLRGAVGLWESRRRTGSSAAWWLLLLAPLASVLCSPYQLHLVSYYSDTAFNSSFSTYLRQWAPTSFSPISAPLLLLLFLTAWMLGRSRESYSLYERMLLLLALALGLLAVRNWAFAALLVLMLAPVGFDRALRRRPVGHAPTVGAAIAVAAGIAALAGTVVALSAPNAKLTPSYRAEAGQAAAIAAARTGAVVYGGPVFSDWLLWMHPELRGRVAFDIRYELLRGSELKRLILFSNGSGLDRPLGRPRVYVLDPHTDKQAVRGLRGAVRIVYETEDALVAVSRQSS